MGLMIDKPAKTLIERFAQKQPGGHFACPRCGKMTMDSESVTHNALSRRATVYICDACVELCSEIIEEEMNEEEDGTDAEEINLQGDFAHIQNNGVPQGWHVTRAKFYEPTPKFQILKEKDKNILHVSDITGQEAKISTAHTEGCVIGNRLYDVKSTKGQSGKSPG